MGYQLVTETSPIQHATLTTNIHAPSGIRTNSLSWQTAIDLCLRWRGHWDQHIECVDGVNLINFDVCIVLVFSVLLISFVNVLFYCCVDGVMICITPTIVMPFQLQR